MTTSPCRFDRQAFTHVGGGACPLPPADSAQRVFAYAHRCPDASDRIHWCVPAAEADGTAATWGDAVRAIRGLSEQTGQRFSAATPCPTRHEQHCEPATLWVSESVDRPTEQIGTMISLSEPGFYYAVMLQSEPTGGLPPAPRRRGR